MWKTKNYRHGSHLFATGALPGDVSSGSRRGRQAEGKSRTETPLARLVRPVRRRNVTEGCAVHVCIRKVEIRMIRCVQRLSTKLKLNLLRDRERTENAHVSLEEAWATKVVSAGTSKASAILQCPGTIRGARNSEYGWTSKNRIVKPRTTSSTTLGRCSNSAEDSNGWVDLIWHLTTTASEQGWRSILDNIERYPTHDAHHTADLEATEDFARQTFLGPSLTLAKRQVIDQIALEIVRPVIAGRAAV